MICPHCAVGISPNWDSHPMGRETDADGRTRSLTAASANCPQCQRLLVLGQWNINRGAHRLIELEPEFVLVPPGPRTRLVAPEVDDAYAAEFRDAAQLVDLSPKASAALSRRLLQRLLREVGKAKPGRLNNEINEVTRRGDLPPGLAEDLHAVREVGNFAAHPTKDSNTGEILDVEDGEAEFLLDVLDALLAHYFVWPARRAESLAKVNVKLKAAGKAPLPISSVVRESAVERTVPEDSSA